MWQTQEEEVEGEKRGEHYHKWRQGRVEARWGLGEGRRQEPGGSRHKPPSARLPPQLLHLLDLLQKSQSYSSPSLHSTSRQI